MGFDTEAAQIKDTSLQISDMKIPQDVKKLGQQFEKWRPPKKKQSGWENNPVDTADKQAHMRKARTVQPIKTTYEMSKVQSLQFCLQVQGPT